MPDPGHQQEPKDRCEGHQGRDTGDYIDGAEAVKRFAFRNEREFQAHVVEMAEALGWLVFHPYDSRRSQPGFPDLCMVRGGRLIFAELKTSKGRLTHTQRSWIMALGETAAETYVWRPGSRDAIEEILT